MDTVAALTGWDDAQMRCGHQSKEGQAMRAEATVARYFLRQRFPGLLLVFEFARECELVSTIY